jgi:epoxyqueuosine reductase
MEKVWAARAGLGYVARNGCLVTPEFGSWVVLAAMVLDKAVEPEAYGPGPTEERCGRCRLCIDACPTSALDGEGGVDARRCLSYQTIENAGPVPFELRPALERTVFGCDVCQAVCPLNHSPVSTQDARFAPRPVAGLDARALAALTRPAYEALVPGTALARAGFDGLRRNAAYALGAARDAAARSVLEQLCRDASPRVSEAARWALTRLPA